MNTTDITVLGRHYTVACPPEQQSHLHTIATELDSRITELKQRTGSVSLEHLAVMAALNLLHEKEELQIDLATEQFQMQRRLKQLDLQIAQGLDKHTTKLKKAVEPSSEDS